MSFLGEIKRRKVFQVAATYAVVAWLLVQVISVVAEPLGLPDWFDTAVIVLLAIGFPITLIMSWAFNLTPEGLVLDQGSISATDRSGKRLEHVLIGLLVVAVGWVVYRVEFDVGRSPTERGALPNSIAVLLCDNFSTDPENAFFAASLHEELLNQLFKLSNLNVIARTSVLQYANAERPITEIADELRVESVMECSVAYGDGLIVISAQLIDGETGLHLWSDRYNREFADVFGIQADIATNVANALAVEFSLEEQAAIEREPTESPEAYALYLRGQDAMTVDRNSAIGYWNQAIEIDPDFALARAQIALQVANSVINVSGQDAVSPSERDARIRTALQEADRAIAIDPTLWVPYQIKAQIDAFSWRWSDAAEAFQRVPDAQRVAVGVLLDAFRGQPEESISIARSAARVRPGDPVPLIILAFTLRYEGRIEEARQTLQTAINLDPTNPLAHSWLAVIEVALGNETGAFSELRLTEQLLGESRSAVLLPELAYGYSRIGRSEDAKRIFEELESRSSDAFIGAGGWAAANLAIGEVERAKEWLLEAIEKIDRNEIDEGFFNLMSVLRMNTLGDPLLEEPDFVALREQLRGE